MAKAAESLAEKVTDSLETVGEKIHDLVLGDQEKKEAEILKTEEVPPALVYPYTTDPKLLMSMTPARMALNPEAFSYLTSHTGQEKEKPSEVFCGKGAEEQSLPMRVEMSSRRLPTRRHETKNVTKYVSPNILEKERTKVLQEPA